MPVNPKKNKKKKAEVPVQTENVEQDEEMHDGAGPSQPQQVFKPGVDKLDEGEELDYDRTAYDCLHKWSSTWPCLSFDIVKDNLGGPRSQFPHTVFLIAGTQAAGQQPNSLEVMKLSELGQGDHGKQGNKNSEDEMEDDEDADEEGDAVIPETAKFHCRTVSHKAAVNRIRCMPQQPGIVAVWGDNSVVSVMNLSRTISDLGEQSEPQTKVKGNKVTQVKPMQTHSHAREGFALSWSLQSIGTLASGDCRGGLHVWNPKEGGSWTVSGAYSGHSDSVEDIQWSPTEGTVFATACVDKQIRVYDTRDRTKPQITIPAHSADVNVISWNTLTTFMLASGSDDKHMRVWDLRALESHIASFDYHSGPVTSIEWCPHESSMLATCSEDNTLAVWDLALERDQEEELNMAPQSTALSQEAPPQLMFLHAGMSDPKELHWHPQIPGMLATTAADCFNLFKPSNVFEISEQESKMQ